MSPSNECGRSRAPPRRRWRGRLELLKLRWGPGSSFATMLLRTLATAMLALLFVLLVAVAAAPVQEEEPPGRVRRDACDATGWEWLNEAACATQCRLDDYKESKCLLGKCVCYTLPIAIE